MHLLPASPTMTARFRGLDHQAEAECHDGAEWQCPDQPDAFNAIASRSSLGGMLNHATKRCRWRSPAVPRLILINGPLSAPE